MLHDIECDCVRLLATGLFSSALPNLRRPTEMDAPQFLRVRGEELGSLATVPPLGSIEFTVSPRKCVYEVVKQGMLQ